MKLLWVELKWLIETIGYKLRPYDMLSDRRRWFWQKRTLCQFFGGTPYDD